MAGLGLGIYQGIHDATTDSQETQDEEDANQKKKSIGSETFAGSNVAPTLSSVTSGAVTSTSF